MKNCLIQYVCTVSYCLTLFTHTHKFVGVYHVIILHWKDYIKHAINTAEILLLTQTKYYSLHVQSCIFINDVHEGLKHHNCLTVKCTNMEHLRTGMIQIHHCVFSSQLLQTSWIHRYTVSWGSLSCVVLVVLCW